MKKNSVRVHLRYRGVLCFGLLVAASVLSLAFTGCSAKKKPGRAPGAAPPPLFTGPGYLHNTVGSLAQIDGYTPMLVSNHSLIVDLPETGSRQVPLELRQVLINELRKQGVGSASKGMRWLSPERMLNDKGSAVVAVQGFIPPGAIPGTKFDLLVSALPGTDTTSLAGGRLWRTKLAVLGTELAGRYIHEEADAIGPVYMNPLYHNEEGSKAKRTFQRQAIVIGGGTVTRKRELRLVLNQPSSMRARLISNRINEKFGEITDRADLAKPANQSRIDINVPKRWMYQTEELMRLIMSTYLEVSPGFEERKAAQLVKVLEKNPSEEKRVSYAWRALGKMSLPVLKLIYDSPKPHVQRAALAAGAWLGDETTTQYLANYAKSEDMATRKFAAEQMMFLAKSIRGEAIMSQLLDDVVLEVRVAAYESLAVNNHQLLERYVVKDKMGGVKFIVDRIEGVTRPMIYVTHRTGVPRIVLFNSQLRLDDVGFGALWNNRLMVRSDGQGVATVYYMPTKRERVLALSEGEKTPKSEGQQFTIDSTVASLIYVLSHRTNMDDPNPGLNLTYSQVVDTLYVLSKSGYIDAPIELELSPLQKLIDAYEQEEDLSIQRQETADAETDDGVSEVTEGLPTAPQSGRPDTMRAETEASDEPDVEK
ncbi:flagellar basal body P-ring protein FlgI [Poriferisphaera sp. WC338]|uniref:flagellar basal body P-ring protein FlgI n=1 Tax=Poriferisphaera sp. WC338 TaxID=3425129 RepID=UPI003D8138F8